ncbi:site-2 protease family protein [[Collinsella] massiliensis]|uniref:Site-2 protease family protein n=1 Tax=[Collinsella] massiliensis TaxID=1232426 RepID=A0A1Y3Y4A6_9ACTN|nr:site-2 protease family protein [[Collinsella] massiliensis]OUN89150.1 site-2 protease family protein [[Collinsella] massiliensis]
MGRLVSILISALAVIIGIVVHESAHALTAYLLGDSTARSRGRVSLNPLNHIDPFGTVILPLLMVLAGGPVFAYAKPVPVYLGNLKHPKRDEVLVALSGPVSNILIACLAALVLSLSSPALLSGSLSYRLSNLIASFLITCMSVNLSLAFFNLIPLPPLDGSSILVPFLHGDALRTYYQVQRYAMPILIIVLYLLPSLTGIDIIGWYFDLTVYPILNALLSFAL